MKVKWVVLAVAFLVGFVLPTCVHAQTAASATVVGTITDQSNANVPGATVKLTNTATGVSTTATANDAGQYTFAKLWPQLGWL